MPQLEGVLKRRRFLQILRDTDLSRGKTSWLLTLLKIPKFDLEHMQKIKKVAELRNAFVHYKWQGIEFDKKRPWDEYKNSLVDIERTVSYFQTLEHNFVFGQTDKSQF